MSSRLTAAVVLTTVGIALATPHARAQDDDSAPPATLGPRLDKARKLVRLQQEGGDVSEMRREVSIRCKRVGADHDTSIRAGEAISDSELVDLTAIPMAERLSEATLDAAIAFYSSLAGRTLAVKMPEISRISMRGREAWIERIVQGAVPKRAAAEQDLRTLGDAVKTFRIRKGMLPAKLAEVADEMPSGVIPRDPWGNEYRYVVVSKKQFDLLCLGADGREGGEDDAADFRLDR